MVETKHVPHGEEEPWGNNFPATYMSSGLFFPQLKKILAS
jgi:hypothetical protein